MARSMSVLMLWFLVSLGSAAPAAVMMDNALVKMTSRYRQYKYSKEDMALFLCLGEVFDQYFRAYELVMPPEYVEERERLGAYLRAKNLSEAHRKDLVNSYNRNWPNLDKATRDLLTELRRKETIPEVPTFTTLDQPFLDGYLVNLQTCTDPEFISAVEQMAPPPSRLSLRKKFVSGMRSTFVSSAQNAVGHKLFGSEAIPDQFRGKIMVKYTRVHKSVSEWLKEVSER